MPGARMVPGREMSIPCSADFWAARRGASRAASICCLSWLKRMPRAFLASGGADLSQASLMSLRRPCLRPSQWRRKASASVVSACADFFGEGGEGGVEGGFVEVVGVGGCLRSLAVCSRLHLFLFRYRSVKGERMTARSRHLGVQPLRNDGGDYGWGGLI